MHDHDDPCVSPPSAEALIAGAVSLMTAWAESCPGCAAGSPGQRGTLADKLVMHLYILSLHPDVTPAVQERMAQAHQRWLRMVRMPAFAEDASSVELAAAAH